MYLLDRERTGRIAYETGKNQCDLKLIWETTLPQHPQKGPESTCVIDNSSNIYFGCHDGCIYSLNDQGKIRWQFVTEEKVYSSPVLHNEKLYFCCNKSDVLCLDLKGNLIWKFEGTNFIKNSTLKKIVTYGYNSLIYDYYFSFYEKIKNLSKIYAWCSPNILDNDTIVVNLSGIGVVALNTHNGKVCWSTNIGYPNNHLAGVAITKIFDKNYIAAVSQSNGLYWLNESGEVIWKKSLVKFANSWGNPSIDKEENAIYCSTSMYNKKSWIFKFEYDGKMAWKKKISAGIRGAVTITNFDYVVVPSLNGYIYIISKKTGEIVNSHKVADKDKGLWTSVVVDTQENIIFNTKKSPYKGALMKINKEGIKLWEYSYGKALSVPVIDSNNNIYVGTWEGKFLKLHGN